MRVRKTEKNLKTNEVKSEVIDLHFCKDLNSRVFDCRIGGEIKWLNYPDFLRLVANDYSGEILRDNDEGFCYKSWGYEISFEYDV